MAEVIQFRCHVSISMQMRLHLASTAVAILGCAGCLSLSSEDCLRLKELKQIGYSLENPPSGFSAPAHEKTAAGLNLLPGVGNAYLANKGAGDKQWAIGVGNLLLWPVSPLWSVAEGYLDARTLNRRTLVAYCEEHPKLLNKELRRDILVEHTEVSPLSHDAERTVETAEQPVPPYEIETIQPYSEGKAVYRITITDASISAFAVERMVRPEIERILRIAFAAEAPGVSDSSIRAFAIPDFGPDRTLLLTGRVFSIEPVADGWFYDSTTHRGRIRLRVNGGMSSEEAKRWVRENIATIIGEKNIPVEAGKALPSGATYRSLDEKFESGVLTVEFEAMQ